MSDIEYNKKLRDFEKARAVETCKQFSEYLKNNDIEGFLDIVNYTYGKSLTGVCSQFLVESGIDIFKYMNDIPLGTFFERTLSSVIIPSNIKNIGPRAFFDTDIEDILIPGNIKIIGHHAFSDCDYLSVIEIEQGVEKICDGAFTHVGDYTNKDVEIYLPDSITDMHFQTFVGTNIIVYCHKYSYAEQWCKENDAIYKVI